MGCGGSTPVDSGGSSVVSGGSPVRVWAKGVGTSFEFLNEKNAWEPITDKYIIDQLGRLCAHNSTNAVTYHGGSNGQNYRAVQSRDGMIVQTNVATNVHRSIRLVPFFFEFEEGPRDWRPVVDPEALMSLTAVLASSINKTYKYKSQATGYEGEAEGTLIGEKGLIEQRNVHTQKRRRIRPTPVGPDGKPHFEFLDNGDVWVAVSESCVKQLAAVAVGRGEAYYNIQHTCGPAAGNEFKYHASLGEDGFIVQKNVGTGMERKVRPAPWLGHGTSADESGARIRADPTNGYFRGREEVPEQQAEDGGGIFGMFGGEQSIPTAVPVGGPIGGAQTVTTTTTQTVMMTQMAASTFYVPEQVPMGSAVSPVMLQEAQPLPMAQPIYYYREYSQDSNLSPLPCLALHTHTARVDRGAEMAHV